MQITDFIKQSAQEAFEVLYNFKPSINEITVNETKPDFEGDYTIVLFSFIKQLRKSPDLLAGELGEWLLANKGETLLSFNVIKGFLNLSVTDHYWLQFLTNNNRADAGRQKPNGIKAMIEYSSPNTNKPLHLGHLRNNFLGWSVAEIYKANGYEVLKTCVVNDRGVHICKSMLAWQKFGNGATPESVGLKGDHLVGDYYVMFEKELQRQLLPVLKRLSLGDSTGLTMQETESVHALLHKIKQLSVLLETKVAEMNLADIELLSAEVAVAFVHAKNGELTWNQVLKSMDETGNETNTTDAVQKKLQQILKPVLLLDEKITAEKNALTEIAKDKTSIMQEVRSMLLKWEQGDAATIDLWRKMNAWVYKGFDETYKRIGSDFDIIYYESETYLLGKQLVEEGLKNGVFFRKEDGSIWIDLTHEGLDEKLVLRKDGTSVYITQDIGLARRKYEDFPMQESIYVVGDEQIYHMKVLQLICEKPGMPFAGGIHHLSYGMVDLPTGRMKSREGTVVDADELCDEMEQVAAQKTEELGKVKDFSADDLKRLYHILGMGALKFYLLRVDPKKRMVFNPEESIDFHGFTGPFVQYTYARIQSVLRKFGTAGSQLANNEPLLPLEKALLVALEQYAAVIKQAAIEMNPSAIALYVYDLAKTFNSFYTELSIGKAESSGKKILRLALSELTGFTIKNGMKLLGIDVPEKM